MLASRGAQNGIVDDSPMIRALAVSKRFRRRLKVADILRGRVRAEPFQALTGVSFQVGRGEAFGLMGPNGAGKSTLMRILAGLLVATTGDVRVAGLDPIAAGPAFARNVGYVAADDRGIEPSLSPREHLAFYAALHGLRRSDAMARVDELLERVGMTHHATRPLRELSTGMRRRVALARGLVGKPLVLLLDEPTRGVDPAGMVAIHRYLRSALDDGLTMVIATHDHAEASALCARVGVLNYASLVSIDSPACAHARVHEMAIA